MIRERERSFRRPGTNESSHDEVVDVDDLRRGVGPVDWRSGEGSNPFPLLSSGDLFSLYRLSSSHLSLNERGVGERMAGGEGEGEELPDATPDPRRANGVVMVESDIGSCTDRERERGSDEVMLGELGMENKARVGSRVSGGSSELELVGAEADVGSRGAGWVSSPRRRIDRARSRSGRSC